MIATVKISTEEGERWESTQDFSLFPMQIKEIMLLVEATGLDPATVFLRSCSIGIDCFLEEIGQYNKEIHIADFNRVRFERGMERSEEGKNDR
jgi:hypothetical protein